MLISISGSQGTGKSTLINALPYKCITRKTSRSILSDWGVTLSDVNNDRSLTIRFQDEILARKIADERDAATSSDLYITERTFADLFVYALVAIGKDNEHSDWLDQYHSKCVQAQRSYMGVFFLTGGHFDPVDDGVRAINKHYSNMVDVMLEQYTQSMSAPHQSIFVEQRRMHSPSIPTVESRVKCFEQFVLECGNVSRDSL